MTYASTDMPGVVATPNAEETDDVRITQGTFSHLPDLDGDEIGACLSPAWKACAECHSPCPVGPYNIARALGRAFRVDTSDERKGRA